MVRVVCLWVLAACYSANPVDGLLCSESGKCPDGQACDFETNTCSATPPVTFELTELTAGTDHTCGFDKVGQLRCWGHNDQGQLGVGDADDRAVPAMVTAASPWNHVSAGDKVTCGTQTNGTLWCWGSGDVLAAQSNKPIQVTSSPDQTWVNISVGVQGFCATTRDYATWCQWSPAKTLTLADDTVLAFSVAASNHRQCVMDDTNHLWCWGANDRGQVGTEFLGDGMGGQDVVAPFQLPGLWSSISLGPSHSCARDGADHLVCWGGCGQYQVRDVAAPSSGTCLQRVQVGTSIYRAVSVNANDSCAIDSKFQLTCFGNNEAGQLGRSTIDPLALPGLVEPRHDFIGVAVGGKHVCATASDNVAWCWGDDRFGNLGNGVTSFVEVPLQIGTQTYTKVSAGLTSSCAIATDGTLWCWGNNGAGQIGDGSTTRRPTPMQVGAATDWTAVSVGTNHACGIRSPGTLWCWGNNRTGALGRGSTNDETEHSPSQAGTASDWGDVQAGTMQTCGTRSGMGLWCWGPDFAGPAPAPVQVSGMTGWSISGVALPQLHPEDSLIGVLANDLYDDLNSLPLMPTNHGVTSPQFVSAAAGADHDCALDTGGGVLCWGYNGSGQLGNGSSGGSFPNAAREQRAFVWRAVDAGGNSTCAITAATSELYCWGDGTTVGSKTGLTANPVATPVAPGVQWSAISVGDHHVCGLHMDGTLWCWGNNEQGEIGGGYMGSDRPLRVTPP